MMRAAIVTAAFAVLVLGATGIVARLSKCGNSSEMTFPLDEPVIPNEGGWAVLLEMNNFPSGWSNMSIGFINVERVRNVLLSLGWQSDHISVVKDNLTLSTVQAAVEWLANNTQADDVAFFYIFTHGYWMRNVLMWSSWFPAKWAEVNSSCKILIVDTCLAEEFTTVVEGDPSPHISLACCLMDELAWAGLEEEGLPIIGSVWNYFFTNALTNSSADLNIDGHVSVEEAFNFSTPLVQTYMDQTVFTVPEFLESYHRVGIYPEDYDAYPHPKMDDNYAGELLISVRIVGDLNSDGKVDITDVALCSAAFGSCPGHSRWNPHADINCDNRTDVQDSARVSADFGKYCL